MKAKQDPCLRNDQFWINMYANFVVVLLSVGISSKQKHASTSIRSPVHQSVTPANQRIARCKNSRGMHAPEAKEKSRNKKDGNDLVSEEATATPRTLKKESGDCFALVWMTGVSGTLCVLEFIFVSSLLVLNVCVLFCSLCLAGREQAD